MVTSSPTVLKRWIAAELRRLRAASGLSREQAAAAIHGSQQNVGHMENGRSLPGPLELERLLELYGAADRVAFWRGVREAAKKGTDWWAPFDGAAVPADRALFLGYESSAVLVEGWDAHVVPDLFQTAEYAHASIQGGAPGRSIAEVADLVELRMARQRVVLGGATAPPVRRVVSESALRWQIGDRGILREQLTHLVDVVRRPEVEVRVLPFASGTPSGESFDLLSFPPELAGEPGAVHVGTEVADVLFERPDEVARYRDTMAHLGKRALTPADSVDFIRGLAEELAR